MRAKDIDLAYGRDQADFPVVKRIIHKIAPQRLLDIGCGTGRLFPLYLEVSIPQVVGQELSTWALQQAHQRYPQARFELTHQPITALPYPEKYFDLCISNRVLSAIRVSDLPSVLKKIVHMSRYFYLNEFSLSDGGQPSSYWFRHDYLKILKSFCTFTVVATGLIEKQTYYLFRIDSLRPALSPDDHYLAPKN